MLFVLVFVFYVIMVLVGFNLIVFCFLVVLVNGYFVLINSIGDFVLMILVEIIVSVVFKIFLH